jgi:hypothetical protein
VAGGDPYGFFTPRRAALADFLRAPRHAPGGSFQVRSMDILFLGITLVFFALTVGLVRLCEKV